jgi:pyridoxal phosphate enzyme (YggS family)
MGATADNLQHVLRRVEDAVATAGRPAGSVRLIAVTKTVAAETVAEALASGQRAFGENYVQEALAKIDAVDRLRPAGSAPPEWHFIGPIQSNKTRSIAERFDWVHGVDRERIAERLSAQRDPARGALNVLIEVNVDGEDSKSGCAPDAVPALARLVSALPNLRFAGLMAVPAPRADDSARRAPFARVKALADGLAGDGLPCEHLSMGMSADLEAAIAEGATMVRVGTALFGARPAREATA